jgi:hypothetical protein
MEPRVSQKDEVSRTIARIKADALALVCGLFGGLGLFVMTVWLVLKGGPQPGQHLQLLSQYFIGYTVTWLGAFVGLLYGIVTGGIIGWAIGTTYNKLVNIRKG